MSQKHDALAADLGLFHAYHATPIHYLPAIARCRRIRSKRELSDLGFSSEHFRTTSKNCDSKRGFEDFVHLSNLPLSQLLRAKLAHGFPHIELKVPIGHLRLKDLYLCRYNIARHRMRSFVESPTNGKLRHSLRVPVASGLEECVDLLEAHRDTNLEVLFQGGVDLPTHTIVRAFHQNDCDLIRGIVQLAGWTTTVIEQADYPRSANHVASATRELQRFQADGTYRGSRLEFDQFTAKITRIG